MSETYPLLWVSFHISHHFLLIRLKQLHFKTDHLRINNEWSEYCFSKQRWCKESVAHPHTEGLSTIDPHAVESSIKIGHVFPETESLNSLNNVWRVFRKNWHHWCKSVCVIHEGDFLRCSDLLAQQFLRELSVLCIIVSWLKYAIICPCCCRTFFYCWWEQSSLLECRVRRWRSEP